MRSQTEEFAKLHDVCAELAKQYPESKRLFSSEQFALRWSGRSKEADALAQERLKLLPEDLDAMRALPNNATSREDYVGAYESERALVASAKAEASDLNSLAWDSLFTGNTKQEDAESAVKAAQQGQNSPAILHTLGCVYAELGKTKEAREVLIQAMDALTLDEPDLNYWYAFGRIAEQYGEFETAKNDYLRVSKPNKPNQIPGSSYRLAQNRLKVLGPSASGVPSAKQ